MTPSAWGSRAKATPFDRLSLALPPAMGPDLLSGEILRMGSLCLGIAGVYVGEHGGGRVENTDSLGLVALNAINLPPGTHAHTHTHHLLCCCHLAYQSAPCSPAMWQGLEALEIPNDL